MMQCAVVGPQYASGGEAVRVDVVVRDVPPGVRMRIRLERLWPEPVAHIDEWRGLAPRVGSVTCSFLWRAGPTTELAITAVLRASVVAEGRTAVCTHGVSVVSGSVDRAAASSVAHPAARA